MLTIYLVWGLFGGHSSESPSLSSCPRVIINSLMKRLLGFARVRRRRGCLTFKSFMGAYPRVFSWGLLVTVRPCACLLVLSGLGQFPQLWLFPDGPLALPLLV